MWLAGTNHRDFGFIFVSVRIFRKKRPSCYIWLKGKNMTLEELKIRQLTNQYLLAPADKLTVMRDLCGVQAQFIFAHLKSAGWSKPSRPW